MKKDKIIKYIKRSSIALLTILLYLSSTNLQNEFLSFFHIDPVEMSNLAKVVFLIIWDIVLMGILLLIYHKSYEKDIKDMRKNHKKYYKKAVAVMFVSNVVIMAITGNATSGNEKAIRDLFSASPLYVYFSGVIFAPIVEELIFRKCFYELIPNKALFIFVSGFVFGGMHVLTSFSRPMDLLYLIPYCAPGLVFSYIMAKTDNVLVSTGLHFLHNGILIAVQMFLYLFVN